MTKSSTGGHVEAAAATTNTFMFLAFEWTTPLLVFGREAQIRKDKINFFSFKFTVESSRLFWQATPFSGV